jgi:hypothetical protein
MSCTHDKPLIECQYDGFNWEVWFNFGDMCKGGAYKDLPTDLELRRMYEEWVDACEEAFDKDWRKGTFKFDRHGYWTEDQPELEF